MHSLKSMDLDSLPINLLNHSDLYNLYDLYLEIMTMFEGFISGVHRVPARALMRVHLERIPTIATLSSKINGGITMTDSP